MAGELTDRAVVIIGGTTGLGLSATRACLAAGANTVVVGLDPETTALAAAQLGPSARLLAADARDRDTAARAIEIAVHEFGRFDALYHVAGGSGRRHGDGPLHGISDEGWRFTLDLNLTALFHSNRAAARFFVTNQMGGSVLNMGSVLGYSPSPRYFATHTYAAAKSAVIGFTKSCAAYYGAHDVRFNVIAPALVDTPMAARAAGDERILKFIASKQPLDGGRIGRPEDLDAAVVFFLSDASRFVTGQVLAVDGGWMVSEGQARD
jgi:NAD(P)-dependent dehydrogenase (short-subunit alcohol dehydrogenase family)